LPGIDRPEHFEEAFDHAVLGRVYVIRGEVHQVVTDLDYLIKATDEVSLAQFSSGRIRYQ
jgi:hypothetical protein